MVVWKMRVVVDVVVDNGVYGMEEEKTLIAEQDEKDEHRENAYPRAADTCMCQVVQSAVRQEEDLTGYLRHVFVFIRQTALSSVIRTTFSIIALAVFIIGLARFGKCHIEREIPVFLLFESGVILLKSGIHVIRSCQKRKPGEEGERNPLDTISSIATVFLVLWALTGTVWVFGVYQRVNTDKTDDIDYCDKLVYFTALWFLLTIYCSAFCLAAFTLTLSIYFCLYSRGTKTLPYVVH